MKGNFIQGAFHPVSDPLGEIIGKNPAEPEDDVGVFPFNLESVDASITAANRAFTAWRELDEEKRWKQLHQLQQVIDRRKEELAKALTREIGKPLWESRQEVQSVLKKFDITREQGMQLVAEFKDAYTPASGSCRFKPRGVMAVIAPFNFPLHLAMGHVIPALACGNTVVTKPSELAPLVSETLADCFMEARVPPGVFNLIQGDGRIGEALCRHPQVSGILFTGSFSVGNKIQPLLLEQPGKMIALEMGGKNASVIWEDADLKQAVSLILQSATITTGQRCTATSRLFVHRKCWSEVKTQLQQVIGKISIGNPLHEKTFMGPLVSRTAREKFIAAGLLLADKTAMDLSSKQELPEKGFYVNPVCRLLRDDINCNDPLLDQEIFGPDLSVYLVDSIDETTQKIEASRYGLAASIFTKSRTTFDAFFSGITAGVINWNRPTTGASSALPFGGQKHSGNQFPTALFAPYACTYPVSMSLDDKAATVDRYPGFPEAF